MEGSNYEHVEVQGGGEEKAEADANSSPDQEKNPRDSQDSMYNVVSHQPTSTQDRQNGSSHNLSDVNLHEHDDGFEREGPTGEVEFSADPDGCIEASAISCTRSKDLGDGSGNLECKGPNVGCVLSCDTDTPALVSDCTTELCSANFTLGHLLCTLGLALDTTLTWSEEGVEFEVLGTGVSTSEGFVVSAFGSKIGIADEEKMEKKRKKKEAKKKKGQNKEAEPEGDPSPSGETNEGVDQKDE